MKVVCRRAKDADRASLKALWMSAFEEDTDEDIDRFLDTFGVTETAFVLCENGTVRSMLFLLETAIRRGEECFPVGYIYAGATHPSSRGKGFYRRLLAYACETAEAQGMAAVMLRPATAALAQSYRRLGFTVPLSCCKPTAATQGLQCAVKLSAAEYVAYRRSVLAGGGQAFVDWDERTVGYALAWCDAVQTANGCALIAREDGTVWECVPPDGEEHEVASLLRPIRYAFEDMGSIRFGYGLE